MKVTMRARIALVGCAPLIALAGGVPASAAAASNPSAADAYGVLVATRLLQGNVPVDVGPIAESSSQNPTGGTKNASVASTGPVPSDGSLVQSVGLIQTSTNADNAPQSAATAQTANVKLLPTAGVPQVSADVIKAESTTTCSAVSAAGTQFVNLKVGPVAVPVNPAPNTAIQLGAVTVIINEQHPTSDGRGLVVNGIHIIAPGSLGGTPFPSAPLIQGDIIISHAVSTVVCPATGPGGGGGSTSTNETTPIELTKSAASPTTPQGGTNSYTIDIINHSPSTPCLVNEVIDHLAPGFKPGATAGPLGSSGTTMTRPDGGVDVILEPPTAVTIAPNGGKLASPQTLAVTIDPSTPVGTYANNVELLCSDLGDFEMTGAPITVTPASAAVPAGQAPAGSNNSGATAPAAPTAPAAAELPHTGGPSPLVPITGAIVLAGGLAIAARRRTLPS